MNLQQPQSKRIGNFVKNPNPIQNASTLKTFAYIFFKLMTFISLSFLACTASANPFSMVEAKPISELWINPGFYSYHFQKDKGLNNNDYGLGAEYRYSTVSSITLGVFDNSDQKSSRYTGLYWQPLQVGPVRLGAVIGAIDGYPKMLNGGWFFAVIPTASIEYKRFGANIMFVPSYKDRLYGAISVQLKLKVFDAK